MIPLKATARTASVGVSAMPYITFLPGYWRKEQRITNDFCAARALTLDRNEAQATTDAYAEQKAEQEYNEELRLGCQDQRTIDGELQPATKCWQMNFDKDHFKSWAELKKLEAAYWEAYWKAGRAANFQPHQVKAQIAASKHSRAAGDPLWQKPELFPSDAIVKYTGWEPGIPAKCWPDTLGFYLGIPLTYDATFGPGDTKRTVKPQFSFGFAYAPAPYFNLLVGATRSQVELSTTDMKQVFQLTIGVGGTVDIVGSLFKM